MQSVKTYIQVSKKYMNAKIVTVECGELCKKTYQLRKEI